VRPQSRGSGDPVLEHGSLGALQEQYVYNAMVLLHNGTYHMWYSAVLHPDERALCSRHVPNSICIAYASSQDGSHWAREGVVTMCKGPAGGLDAYACFAGHVVPREDDLWMYYSAGNRYQRYQVALATCPVGLQ